VAAHRLAHHRRCRDAEVVEDRHHVLDVRRAGDVGRPPGAAAVPTLLDRDDPVVDPQRGDRGPPLEGVAGQAVEQHDDGQVTGAVEVPDLGIGPLDPAPAVRHGVSQPPAGRPVRGH
jgi:hypothetical protein